MIVLSIADEGAACTSKLLSVLSMCFVASSSIMIAVCTNDKEVHVVSLLSLLCAPSPSFLGLFELAKTELLVTFLYVRFALLACLVSGMSFCAIIA
jgi:hypothetical protein